MRLTTMGLARLSQKLTCPVSIWPQVTMLFKSLSFQTSGIVSESLKAAARLSVCSIVST